MPALESHLTVLEAASKAYPERLAFRIARKISDSDTVDSWDRISYKKFQDDVELAAKYWRSELSSRGLARRSVVGLW